MIVCICRRVSHRDIERAVRDGCRSFDALQDDLGVASVCGSCMDCAQETFDRACVDTACAGVCSGACSGAQALAHSA